MQYKGKNIYRIGEKKFLYSYESLDGENLENIPRDLPKYLDSLSESSSVLELGKGITKEIKEISKIPSRAKDVCYNFILLDSKYIFGSDGFIMVCKEHRLNIKHRIVIDKLKVKEILEQDAIVFTDKIIVHKGEYKGITGHIIHVCTDYENFVYDVAFECSSAFPLKSVLSKRDYTSMKKMGCKYISLGEDKISMYKHIEAPSFDSIRVSTYIDDSTKEMITNAGIFRDMKLGKIDLKELQPFFNICGTKGFITFHQMKGNDKIMISIKQ